MTQHAAEILGRTALYQAHLGLHARMVPFGGWEMPVQYPTGILAEARAVRANVGMFDVSHMGRLYISGDGAADFLQRVLTADVRALRHGRAKYGFVLNEQGGIIDDIIISNAEGLDIGRHRLKYLLVCNAGNRSAVVLWLHRWLAQFPDVTIHDDTEATVMIAVQGPQAIALANVLAGGGAISGYDTGVLPSTLRPFALTYIRENAMQPNLMPQPTAGVLSRTGYTGEDGFEAMLPVPQGIRMWHLLKERGVVPCGLGARDVLRLEAALPLHGHDIDPATTPIEAGLERFLQETNTEFIGKEALQTQKERGVQRKLVGFRTLEGGIPRQGYALLGTDGATIGAVTSGGVSPTLDADIGMGYVKASSANIGNRIAVDIRGRKVPAEIVPLPFYSRKAPQKEP